MKTRDVIIIALLMLNLAVMLLRDGGAEAASTRRPTPARVVQQSASERSLPVLREIRDVLQGIDLKLGQLVQIQSDTAKANR